MTLHSTEVALFISFWFVAGLISLVWGITELLEHPDWSIGLGVLAVAGAWFGRGFWQQATLNTPLPVTPSTITPGQIEAQLQATRELITVLEQYTPQPELTQQVEILRQARHRSTLEIALWSNVEQNLVQLQAQMAVSFQGIAQVDYCQDLSQPPAADLICVVIGGDLTQTETQALEQLNAQEQRFLVLWVQPSRSHVGELGLVEQELSRKLGKLLPAQDWLIAKAGRLESCQLRLTALIQTEKQALIWRHTLHQAQALHQTVQNSLNQIRRELALPIIQRYQWIGAGAAAVNPLPVLDLVVTGGLLVQLTLELGKLYQRSFSLTQARPLAETLLRLSVQFGAVEVTTQTLTHWLKGNSLTYLAGSCLQGASVAYLLRVGGLSLIDYWQTLAVTPGSTTNWRSQLQASLKKTLHQLPRAAFFRSLQPQP